MTISTTRRQAHIPDVEPTMHGLTDALAQLALAGAPPDAVVAVTYYVGHAGTVVAADWTVEA